MDPHVERMATLLKEAKEAVEGELYDSPVNDAEDRLIGNFPALKASISGRTVRVALLDVPGAQDHFSIIAASRPRFSVSLRKEGQFDWVAKLLGQVADLRVGVKEFDSEYLVSGYPADGVKDYLIREDVRGWLKEINPMEAFAVGSGYVRASFPLTPQSAYTIEDLRQRVVSMVRLAEAAEAIEVASDEDVF
ncbi:MAG: hypothetical protein FJX76_18505 [Armatimonadetes bacterium]|nr:hypothetical protein [Armatimonadota bacterium]